MVGATDFNITGAIDGQTGAAGAASIVFVGGTAAQTGSFNGLATTGNAGGRRQEAARGAARHRHRQ